MGYLAIAQYMGAAVFLTIALLHLTVWFRARSSSSHLLFAMTAAAAGANAIAEENMYRADSVDAMGTALQWYVATSGFWIIAVVWFIAAYTHLGRTGRLLASAITGVFSMALLLNLFSPASFLYTEITSLREIVLPWGESIRLAVGQDNPLRFISELTLFAVLGLVVNGVYQLWRRGQRRRAWWFGAVVLGFMVCFGTHAFLVDTGRLDSPYLSTFGFLALVGLTSYDLAGEIMRTSQLSDQLKQKETQLRTAVADERSRIASELHDSVTQTLFSTAAIADALPEVWRRRPEEAQRALEQLNELTKAALAEMRTLLVELRPSALQDKKLSQLLRQLADAAAGRSNIQIQVEANGNAELPQDVKVELYRIAQEMLNNVIKHSEANTATICLQSADEALVLSMRDDGRGFDPAKIEPGHLGLEIMRERVRTIGADLSIDSKTAHGTELTVRWPLTGRGASNA